MYNNHVTELASFGNSAYTVEEFRLHLVASNYRIPKAFHTMQCELATHRTMNTYKLRFQQTQFTIKSSKLDKYNDESQ